LAGAPQDTTPGEAGAAYVFDVSFLSAMPLAGNSGGGAVGLLTVLLLLLWRRRTT
jgi:MYXO-CTERM domain-containing protein